MAFVPLVFAHFTFALQNDRASRMLFWFFKEINLQLEIKDEQKKALLFNKDLSTS